METYRFKRKSYGIVEGAENVVGGTMKGVGKAADSTLGGIAGAAMGAKYLGEGIGALTGIGGVGGTLLGMGLGAAAMRGTGKGLKAAGDSLTSY